MCPRSCPRASEDNTHGCHQHGPSLPCFHVFVERQVPPATNEEPSDDWNRNKTNLERTKQAGGRASTRRASEESEDEGWSKADLEMHSPLQVGRDGEKSKRTKTPMPQRCTCERIQGEPPAFLSQRLLHGCMQFTAAAEGVSAHVCWGSVETKSHVRMLKGAGFILAVGVKRLECRLFETECPEPCQRCGLQGIACEVERWRGVRNAQC